MTLPVDEARAFCDQLTAGGVRATHDPRKIVPPCLLIVPPNVRMDRSCGGTADWTAYLLASTGAGNADAWAQLDKLAALVLPHLPVETLQPSDYSPDGTTEYPAYALTWTSQVEYGTP